MKISKRRSGCYADYRSETKLIRGLYPVKEYITILLAKKKSTYQQFCVLGTKLKIFDHAKNRIKY